MRVTVVTGMQPLKGASAIESHRKEMRRGIRRTRLLLQGRVETIKNDPDLMRPFAGGIVHTHTETEFNLYPHFRNAYATLDGVTRTSELIESWFEEAERERTNERRPDRKRKRDGESEGLLE